MSIMRELLTKKAVVLSLFAPRSQLKQTGTTLTRSLVFKAGFVSGDLILPRDMPPPYGGPAQRLTAEVHLVELDQVGNSGWVEWTATRRKGARGGRMEFVETEIVNYTFTVPLAKEAIEFADSFHARRQKLLLSVQVIPPTDPLDSEPVLRHYAPQDKGPWPTQFLELAFEPLEG